MPLRHRHDKLPTKDPPPVTARYAVPQAAPGLKERVPLAHGLAAPPETERRSRRATCMFVKHAAGTPIVGDKLSRRRPQVSFLENRPVLEPVAGGLIAG